MPNPMISWQFWALLSAVFAAATAIFAKLGVHDLNADFATFIRTVVILLLLTVLLFATDQFESIASVSHKSLVFLVLSGFASGASWLCYFRALKLGNASQVVPVDKLSVVFVALLAALFLGERLSQTGWLGIGLITVGAMLLISH